MIGTKYYLSEEAKKRLYDRHETLGDPIINFIGNKQLCEPSEGASLLESEIIEGPQIKPDFIKLQNSLIFGFEVDESLLTDQKNAIIIDFKSKYSSEPQSPIRIFIDNLSLYNGITDSEDLDSIELIEKRKRYGQLKLGYNTLVFDNIFLCLFEFTKVLNNDLPNIIGIDEGYDIDTPVESTHIPIIVPSQLNSINELKVIYPYYNKI